jgi:hypothetical protein
MKQEIKPAVVKLSERFDKQLLNILSKELAALKSTKNQIVNAFNPSQEGLKVA